MNERKENAEVSLPETQSGLHSFESCHSKSEEVGLYRHEKQPGGAANPNVASRCGWIDLLERKQRQTRLIDSVSGVYRGIRALLSVSKLVQSEGAYATVLRCLQK